ncbi:MAG: 1-deoxy-D-xylulose-5-phosphate synthase [Simkaniaceae bacterium]|nr:1-deoxy-D-xylulose-5-phosphate synthase [Simkaniaceae bacterium]
MLNTISSPADVKTIPRENLPALADEVRKRIVDVMSEKGGHLGSNLGIVELTIALHRVFNAPLDKIIYDTSHQTYPHKLLTGRNSQFETIRQLDGLCGFTHPVESPYDHFYAGHAGTALSLALGLAESTKESEHVIAVIGDAELSCGLTLEAINNIHKRRVIIVLNDNDMFISPSTGRYTKILREIREGGQRAGEMFFGKLGIQYIGPIDGHDIDRSIEAMERAKESNGPILIHALTEKGHGLDHAIANPVAFHGVKPFHQETGSFKKAGSLTFPKIFGKQMLEMADSDPNLYVISPATPAGSALTAMMEKYPNRCLDVGIAEGHAVTFCGGLGWSRDCKVVCSVYSTFLQRAIDNIFHDVCLQKVPVVFAIDRGGLASGDGVTHNGIYDIGLLRPIPNLAICAPRNGQVQRELFDSAFSWGMPVAIRYPNLATEEAAEPLAYRKLGKGEVVSSGEEIAIVALGHMVSIALEVKERLVEAGYNPTIVDPIFVKPLDEPLFNEILSSHRMVVTIEEHVSSSGLASIVNNFIVTKGYRDIEVVNIGLPDDYIDHGSHASLCDLFGLTSEKIADKLLTIQPVRT